MRIAPPPLAFIIRHLGKSPPYADGCRHGHPEPHLCRLAVQGAGPETGDPKRPQNRPVDLGLSSADLGPGVRNPAALVHKEQEQGLGQDGGTSKFCGPITFAVPFARECQAHGFGIKDYRREHSDGIGRRHRPSHTPGGPMFGGTAVAHPAMGAANASNEAATARMSVGTRSRCRWRARGGSVVVTGSSCVGAHAPCGMGQVRRVDPHDGCWGDWSQDPDSSSDPPPPGQSYVFLLGRAFLAMRRRDL